MRAPWKRALSAHNPNPYLPSTAYDSTAGQAAASILGHWGTMLSTDKLVPFGCEDHTIYWNACVFDRAGVQIWHGDLDLVLSEPLLQSLADEIGTVYVTPELPWRTDGFKRTQRQEAKRVQIVRFDR